VTKKNHFKKSGRFLNYHKRILYEKLLSLMAQIEDEKEDRIELVTK